MTSDAVITLSLYNVLRLEYGQEKGLCYISNDIPRSLKVIGNVVLR